jgi:hypothetical protein
MPTLLRWQAAGGGDTERQKKRLDKLAGMAAVAGMGGFAMD